MNLGSIEAAFPSTWSSPAPIDAQQHPPSSSSSKRSGFVHGPHFTVQHQCTHLPRALKAGENTKELSLKPLKMCSKRGYDELWNLSTEPGVKTRRGKSLSEVQRAQNSHFCGRKKTQTQLFLLPAVGGIKPWRNLVAKMSLEKAPALLEGAEPTMGFTWGVWVIWVSKLRFFCPKIEMPAENWSYPLPARWSGGENYHRY